MDETPRLLFVCTANVCRSPLAAALARRALTDAAAEVASAGLLPGGRRVPPVGLRLAAELGLDLGDHVSRQVDAAALERADVVLTMTRGQARELVAARPELWPRVFTVKHFARWLAAQPSPLPGDGLSRAWLADASAARHPLELLGTDPADEVADPMGRPMRGWREVAGELTWAVDEIARSLRSRLSSPSTP